MCGGRRLFIIMEKLEDSNNETLQKEMLKVIFFIEAKVIEERLQNDIKYNEKRLKTEPSQPNPNWQSLYQCQLYCIELTKKLEQFREAVTYVMNS